MAGIIDFHTHAFPDELAERAIGMLEEASGITAYLDGTVSSLLTSMDRNGIERSVVCTIVTKPSQFETVFEWCRSVVSERIIPFPSLHPDDPKGIERITAIKGEGFKGIKLHPYYQDFHLDEERLFPLYEKMCEENLLVVVHTGYDIAFPRIRRADPAKILRVMDAFPTLKLVTTHLGSWEQWEEVRQLLLGRQIYMEISCSLESLNEEESRSLILNHPERFIFFGSDSPWTDQGESIALVKRLNLGAERERLIFRDNAMDLLYSV